MNNKIRKQLEEICEKDGYGLNPETLYQNILKSTGTSKKLSEIFEVPEKLIKEIKTKTNNLSFR